MITVLTVFLVSAAAAAAAGLPADLAWRRMSAPAAGLAAAASAIALLSIIGIESHAGLLSGVGAVAALIAGFIAGGASADAFASRRWGPAPRHYH
jgi:hypothetical protein